MANGSTPNYAYILPEVASDSGAWGGHTNTNWTDLDTDLKAVSDVADAAMPKAGGAFTGDISGPGGFRQTIDGFARDNVAASLTNSELNRGGGLTPNQGAAIIGRFRAVRAGSITGVVVTAGAARTAGTLTVEVFINTGLAGATGTGTGLTAVLDGSNTSRKATTQAKDLDTFAAGDEVYLVVTTTGTWAPNNTIDIQAAVEIEN